MFQLHENGWTPRILFITSCSASWKQFDIAFSRHWRECDKIVLAVRNSVAWQTLQRLTEYRTQRNMPAGTCNIYTDVPSTAALQSVVVIWSCSVVSVAWSGQAIILTATVWPAMTDAGHSDPRCVTSWRAAWRHGHRAWCHQSREWRAPDAHHRPRPYPPQRK